MRKDIEERKVLLIGGSGFIGSHLTRQLQNMGVTPIVIDPHPPKQEGVEYYPLEQSQIVKEIPEVIGSVEAIYLLAWTTTPQTGNSSPPRDVMENIYSGLLLLDQLVKLEDPPRVIFISTGGAIYGDNEEGSYKELDCVSPISSYGIGKLTFEYYLKLYRRLYGLDYLIARPGNPYGPGQSPYSNQGVVAVFLGHALNRQLIQVWGDGDVVRDYLYIEDLVSGLCMLLEYYPTDINASRVFNFGSEKGVSLNTLLQEIKEIVVEPIEVSFTHARLADVSSIVLDSNQAKSSLGWTASTSLKEGLKKTWRWIKEQQS